MRKTIVKKLLKSVKKTITGFLRPVYYSYTSFKIFNLFQKITGYRQEKRRFFKSIGYHPDIEKPESFNEKVLFKKFYGFCPASLCSFIFLTSSAFWIISMAFSLWPI